MKAKLTRISKSLLPVSKARAGSCNGCGDCCEIDFKCPFLRRDEAGKGHCRIYRFRPPNCRKYPRIASEMEQIPHCSYRFNSEDGAMVSPVVWVDANTANSAQRQQN